MRGVGLPVWKKLGLQKAMNDNESGPPVNEHDPTANKKEA
jgi:hypothetical protein